MWRVFTSFGSLTDLSKWKSHEKKTGPPQNPESQNHISDLSFHCEGFLKWDVPWCTLKIIHLYPFNYKSIAGFSMKQTWGTPMTMGIPLSSRLQVGTCFNRGHLRSPPLLLSNRRGDHITLRRLLQQEECFSPAPCHRILRAPWKSKIKTALDSLGLWNYETETKLFLLFQDQVIYI